MAGLGPDKSLTPVVLAFLAGTLVGGNWPKIKKQLSPFLGSLEGSLGNMSESITRFFAEHKERIEDQIEAAKINKKAKTKKAAKPKAGKAKT